MRRRRYASSALALTGWQAQAIENAVKRAALRLLGTVPRFPLTQDEVEEFFMPRAQREQVRAAMKLIPDLMSSRQSLSLITHLPGPPERAGEAPTKRRFTVTLSASQYSYSGSGKTKGFVVPPQRVEGHVIPEASRAKLNAWVEARWKAGVEAGYIVALMQAVFDIAKTPNQIFKVWPELLKLSQDEDVQRLLSKVSGMTRAQVPDGWTQAHVAAVPVANFILAKVALLPDYSGPAGVEHVVCTGLARDGRKPITKFGAEIVAM